MRFSLRTIALGGFGALLFCGACEKHSTNEWPELQRDRLHDDAAGHSAHDAKQLGDGAHPDKATRAEPAHSTSPLPAATPVDFFPEQKKP